MARDVADIRLDNTFLLYSEFVRDRIGADVDPREVALEGPFAEQLRISPSYWSQLKSRNRQIGETLARQFESLSGKPAGWLDREQSDPRQPQGTGLPRSDDERFLVQLLLTAYRMNPDSVKQRVLELMEGELAKAKSVKKPHSRK
jgi:hypothetical protein